MKYIKCLGIVSIIILSLTGCGKKEVVEKKPKKEIETKPEVSCLDKVNNGDFSCYTGEYINYFKTSNEVFDNEYFFKLKNERKFEIKENGSICFTNENASLPTSEYQICIYPVGTPLTINVCDVDDGDYSLINSGFTTDTSVVRVYWQTSSGCTDYRQSLYLKK